MGVAGRMRQPYERVRATMHGRLELVRTLAAASPWLVAAAAAAALVAGLVPVTHAELLRHDGRYASMYRTQAEGYA